MAVATDCEDGLYIGGELTEPTSGDVRDFTASATGDALARTAMSIVSSGSRPIDPFGP